MKKLIAAARPGLLGLLATFTLGSMATTQAAMIWHWQGTAPGGTIQTEITNAMNAAIGNYNSVSGNFWTGDCAVNYNSGVPTAQTAGWHGLITFGAYRNTRTAQHEVGHWFAVGTYQPSWNNFRSGNTWTGAHGIAKVQSFDGAGATLSADAQHMWPYGLNYDSEWNSNSSSRNIHVVSATRWDMGLTHF